MAICSLSASMLTLIYLPRFSWLWPYVYRESPEVGQKPGLPDTDALNERSLAWSATSLAHFS